MSKEEKDILDVVIEKLGKKIKMILQTLCIKSKLMLKLLRERLYHSNMRKA